MQVSELLTSIPTWRDAEDRWTADDATYLLNYADHLIARPPERVLGVVALPWPRGTRDRWTRLIAFARYRSAYAIIEELATVFAPGALQTGLVPLIVPIRDRDLLGMTADTPFVRRSVQSGVVLFDRIRPR